jgi:hypothetical protein
MTTSAIHGLRLPCVRAIWAARCDDRDANRFASDPSLVTCAKCQRLIAEDVAEDAITQRTEVPT